MIIKDHGSKFLADQEVLAVLKARCEDPTTTTKSQEQVSKALQELGAKEVDRAAVKDFLNACKESGIKSKSEALQLANNKPISSVVVYLILKDCESRFTEDEISQLVKLVKEKLC